VRLEQGRLPVLDAAMASTENAPMLGDGSPLPPHDEFYRELTTRNTPLVTPEEQEKLRTATILIAGCGSIGGAAVEPLIRLGCENLILAEPDGYDVANMNRQSCRLQDVGKNKAAVFAERMREINPYATVEVHDHGITAENVDDVTSRADVILDGVDVTTKPPLRHKVNLHMRARERGKVVVSGYDIAGLQMLLVYDYSDPGTALMAGKVKPDEVEKLEPFEFLARVIPFTAIPIEIIPELERQVKGEGGGFPQLVYTAQLFGVLAVRAVMDIVAGRPTRKRVIVDANAALRPRGQRPGIETKRIRALLRLNKQAKALRKGTGDAPDLVH
jgi:molybdopterin/thiamine biosynthesis adenylyltransferase